MTREGSLLLLGLALTLPGCIFAEPPQNEPLQTPVFFDVSGTVPLPTQLVHFELQDPLREFSVPIKSEDAGEELWWVAHVNLTVGGEPNPTHGPVPIEPSNLNDTSRIIRFTYKPTRVCEQLTLMACHDANFRFGPQLCDSAATDDTAMTVWWLTLGDVTQATLSQCPQPQPSTAP